MSDALEREFVTFVKQLPENMYRKLKELINAKQKYANVLHYYDMTDMYLCKSEDLHLITL